MSSIFLTTTTSSLSASLFTLNLFSARPRVATPRYNIMLLSLPKNWRLVTAQVPYPFFFIITAGITFVMLLKILMIALPIPAFQSSPASSRLEATRDEFASKWVPPTSTDINNHDRALDGTGPMAKKIVPWTKAAGSGQPEGLQYGEYNYCNMPHVRTKEYARKDEKEWKLVYVEVIQRHHKRTPYAACTFPHEAYPWYCDDAQLYQYGRPYPAGNTSATTYWHIIDNDNPSGSVTPKVTPFLASGFRGTCQFPQITRGGLDDSWQHGKDLYGVYHDMLHLIPDTPSDADLANPNAPFHQQVRFRVTNNPITSQVAGMLLNGMFGTTGAHPLHIQPKSIDSLEPSYACPDSADSMRSYGPGSSRSASDASSSTSRWLDHLESSSQLFDRLDRVSGVSPRDPEFHRSFDHYFDNLSSRLCHSMSLPCNESLPANERCITQVEAEEVFRKGMWEYSHIYRDSHESLEMSVGSMGVWLAELVQHLRDVVTGTELKYMHNVAHDGSISKLLSALQVDIMVWPGLGSELVFELFKKKAGIVDDTASATVEDRRRDEFDSTIMPAVSPSTIGTSSYYIRVLWGGKVFKSSDPKLGEVDMLPLEDFLEYVDDLVGFRASKIKELCGL